MAGGRGAAGRKMAPPAASPQARGPAPCLAPGSPQGRGGCGRGDRALLLSCSDGNEPPVPVLEPGPPLSRAGERSAGRAEARRAQRAGDARRAPRRVPGFSP